MDETGRKAEFSSIENPAQLPAVLDALDDPGQRATDFARASRSVATLRAYRADWSDFSAWCESVGRERLPTDPETVGLYLAARARELKVATLRRRVASIAVANKLVGGRLDTRHPAIADVLAGIRRELGARASPKNAISVDELRAMLRKLPDTVSGIRDRVILLIGFAGAFRRFRADCARPARSRPDHRDTSEPQGDVPGGGPRGLVSARQHHGRSGLPADLAPRPRQPAASVRQGLGWGPKARRRAHRPRPGKVRWPQPAPRVHDGRQRRRRRPRADHRHRWQ